eukprot:gene7365-9048_t
MAYGLRNRGMPKDQIDKRVREAAATLELPASTFVASFIGAPPMNLIPITADESGLILKDGTRIGAQGITVSDKDAIIGFRPEDLEVATGTESHIGGLLLDLKVLGVEPVGAESYVYGIIGGERVVVRVAGRSVSQPDDHLRVIIPKEKLHLFGGNGKRI